MAFVLAQGSPLHPSPPGEVYVVPPKARVVGGTLYWRTGPHESRRTLWPYLRMGENYSILLRLRTVDGALVHESSDTLPIHLHVAPDTMYRIDMGCAGQSSWAWRWKGVVMPSLNLQADEPPMVASPTPAQWFWPDTDHLNP